MEFFYISNKNDVLDIRNPSQNSINSKSIYLSDLSEIKSSDSSSKNDTNLNVRNTYNDADNIYIFSYNKEINQSYYDNFYKDE